MAGSAVYTVLPRSWLSSIRLGGSGSGEMHNRPSSVLDFTLVPGVRGSACRKLLCDLGVAELLPLASREGVAARPKPENTPAQDTCIKTARHGLA